MNTLKIDIKSLEIADNDVLVGGYENTRYFDFNEAFNTKIQLDNSQGYKTIELSQITSPFMFVLVSDKEINAKINETEFTNTKMLLLNTNISSIALSNSGLETANVSILAWGVQ